MTDDKKLPRKPGALKAKIRISDDFDEFTEQDEEDWYSWSDSPVQDDESRNPAPEIDTEPEH